MRWLAAAVASAVLVAACADDTVTGGGADADVAADADADADAAADVDTDPDADAAADAVADADAAADSDSAADADSDSDSDSTPEAPEITLTVNELGPRYDGSLAYVEDGASKDYDVWVNRADFTLDVLVDSKAGSVDPESLDVRCDAALVLPDGSLVDASEAIPIGAWEAAPYGHRVHFAGDSGLSDGQPVTCSADASGPGGEASGSVSFVAATLPPELDPFVTPDTWLVVLSRDIFSITVTPNADGTYSVVSDYLPEGDGEPDFAQPFYAIGLMSEAAPEIAAAMRARLLARIRELANEMFGLDAAGLPTPEGVPLQLVWEGDPGAPDPGSWSSDGTFSMIALGGDGKPEDQTSGIVGRAAVDWNNQGVEDNTIYGRGVYPTAMVRSVLGQAIGVFALQEFLPGVGTPLGEHPDDALLFDPDFDPDTASQDLYTRWQLLDLAVEMIGRALASTLCHEIGHSLGLVAHGPPPHGLFAGMPGLDFVDNFVPGAHIDTPGLNIMQTGAVTNWAQAVDQLARFNPLNLAYLRRRIVVLGDLNPD